MYTFLFSYYIYRRILILSQSNILFECILFIYFLAL